MYFNNIKKTNVGKFSTYFYVHFRKDAELNSLHSRLEDEQSLVAQLQRKIKELQVTIWIELDLINNLLS